MRDAIGGTFMLRILIIFIVLYIVFMCFAVSYAKTFRLKNGVIDMLEHSQYQNDDNDWNNIAEGTIKSFLDSSAYNFPSAHHVQIKNHCENEVRGKLTSNGVCIVSKDDGDARYYQVYLYIVYYFPFFHWEVVMPIGGETDIIPKI